MSTVSRGLRALALALLVLGLLPVGTGPAAAHAALVSSDPRDGARLEQLPGRVMLTFTEEVSSPAYVVVRTSGGTQLASGDPEVDGATVLQPLAADGVSGGVSGEVTVAYRVVSVDGHPVTGEISFTVAPPSGSAADPSTGPSEPAAEPSAGDAAGGSGSEPAAEAAAAEPASEGFWASHGSHYVLGGFLVLVAGGLLWMARGRASP
ncbi:copper resistance protein CopC [Nocardioides sp. HDW12B]|uniref:copper resistance CopC family protein n=1 Tax=Nocardioides sp. HDW12B TaxID=2714939 RepID=UPI001409823B|nr:copper resistance CopC family protein [Nocardioides sp. HDW12B]QIK68001.1 copper resistance protein CopC [Nocardioides sp. HDW12B]